jgi:DNA-binding response OmpR family regulator
VTYDQRETMTADAEQTRVLVVEDEQKVADLYEIWLADEYDVRTAYSGEEALERMADREVDVVLLDRQMPSLSGDGVAHRLDENGSDAQVVMVTALSPSPEMATLPIDDYIVKPVKPEQLRSTVETAALARTYDDEVTELLALIARRETLEATVSADELETNEEFDRLTTRITNLQDSIDATVEELWQDSDTDVFARMTDEVAAHRTEHR